MNILANQCTSTCSGNLIREANLNEVMELVELHVDAFPEFFLTSLGRPFLRLLYNGFCTVETGICIVDESGGKISGVVAGTNLPGRFFKDLLWKKGLFFAFSAVPGLLRNPLFVAKKCFGALFYRGESPDKMPGAALLSSLAVSSHTMRKGIGGALVHAFLLEAKRRGAEAVYLTTDASDNDSANRFYSNCGFTLEDSFKRTNNRTMNRWVILI